MEMSDSPRWRLANLKVLLFIVTCAVISIIPTQPLWFGFITDRMMQLSLAVAAGMAVFKLSKDYGSAIADYVPSTPLQAKRANEQIKLTATFANTIAAACVGVVALSQLVKPEGPDNYIIAMAVMIAGIIHNGARDIVGLIKDDTLPSASQS